MEQNHKLTPISQSLRRNQTKEENLLWYNFLRHYPCRFRRQYVIGDYIVDFYCPKAHICIELDGQEHYTMQGDTRDYDRTVFLNSNGIKVLRFENREIWEDINRVLETIKIELGFD